MSQKKQKTKAERKIAEHKININAKEAVKICNTIHGLGGSGGMKLRRLNVYKKTLTLFPEVEPESQDELPGNDIKRQLELDLREVRALAYGLFSQMDRADTNNAGFEVLVGVCKSLKVWGFVEALLLKEEVPEFDGAFDDEPPLVDQDPEEAEG